MSKVYIQDSFEGMPNTNNAIRDCHLSPDIEVVTSFKVGEVYYQVSENKLQAFKVLGMLIGKYNYTILHTQHPDGAIWFHHVNKSTSNPFFRSVDDYYKYMEGNTSAKMSIQTARLDYVMPTQFLVQHEVSYTPVLASRIYYTFNERTQQPEENYGFVRRLYYDGSDWYVQSSAFRNIPMSKYEGVTKYYTSKAECIKDNMAVEIVDFNTNEPPKVEVSVKIKVTPPAPKVTKLIITEEA
jgi:hypothetical protein